MSEILDEGGGFILELKEIMLTLVLIPFESLWSERMEIPRDKYEK